MQSSIISQLSVSFDWVLVLSVGFPTIFVTLFISRTMFVSALTGGGHFNINMLTRSAGAAIFIIVATISLSTVPNERVTFVLWHLAKLLAPLLLVVQLKLLSNIISFSDLQGIAPPPRQSAKDSPEFELPVLEAETPQSQQIYNLDILVTQDRLRRDYYYIHVIKSPTEELKTPAYRRFSRQAVQELLFYAQNLVTEAEDIHKLGRYLYEFLFPPEVKTVLDQSYGFLQKDSVLRLRLRWGDYKTNKELAQLPWEYMHDGSQFLALNRQLSIVRYHHGRQPNTLKASNKLRVLVIASNPRNMPPLDIDNELKALKAALPIESQQGHIDLRIEKNVTARQLRLSIANFQPHILHFAGHGRREEKMGELILCDKEQNPYPITADDLHVMLKGSRFMRLVVLSGCETAANPTANTAIHSVAGQLVDAGIPAVIGIRYELPNEIAPSMMSDFYTAIVNELSLEQALTETRIGLYCDRHDKNYWALPVLFLRTRESRLFRVSSC